MFTSALGWYSKWAVWNIGYQITWWYSETSWLSWFLQPSWSAWCLLWTIPSPTPCHYHHDYHHGQSKTSGFHLHHIIMVMQHDHDEAHTRKWSELPMPDRSGVSISYINNMSKLKEAWKPTHIMCFRNFETNALGTQSEATGLNKTYFGSFFIHLNKINVISLILSNDCKSQ